MGRTVLADQLTLHAKHRSLQFDKTDALPGEPFSHVLELSPEGSEGIETKCGHDAVKVAGLVRAVDNVRSGCRPPRTLTSLRRQQLRFL